MNPSHLVFRLAFLLVSFGVGCAVVHAEDRKGIVARIEGRLSSVIQLKNQKLVGENNRGYLEARAALNGTQQSVISDENADRRALYELIAREQKVNVEQVGRGRAQKIAATEGRGHWLQGNDGAWYQKP